MTNPPRICRSEDIWPEGRGGIVMVDFVKDCIDDNAPEVCADGVASIERISEHQMRITYYKCRKGERLAVVSLIWERERWLTMWKFWDEARSAISAEGFELPAWSQPDERRH